MVVVGGSVVVVAVVAVVGGTMYQQRSAQDGWKILILTKKATTSTVGRPKVQHQHPNPELETIDVFFIDGCYIMLFCPG